jgi:uncharacterized protein
MEPLTEERAVGRRVSGLGVKYGPWAVVTGASDGIGRAIAVELAATGMNLVLVARRQDVLDALARDLRTQHAIETRTVALDLARPSSVEALLHATRALDVGLLVAAAGYGTSGSFCEAELEPELVMIDLNCRVVAALAHAYGRRFAARGRGGIVLMSSLLAFQGVPGAANYAATKAYVQTLAEGLRQELAPRGVDVLASAPGPVHSGFGACAPMKMTAATTPREVARGTLAALGRWGTVRPGLLSRLLELSLSLLPRWGRVRMLGVVMRGMTKHHGAPAALAAGARKRA